MATTTATPSAPIPTGGAATPSSAPPATPVSASATSSSGSPASATPATSPGNRSRAVSSVDPAKYPVREDYAKALLEAQMGAIREPAVEAAVIEAATEPAAETEANVPGDLAAETQEQTGLVEAESRRPEVTSAAEPEEIFELEPPSPVTPDGLSQMVKENAELAKLLEADPRLKGQLYRTAREAAELKPYREMFADVESAKTAQAQSATWIDVRETFLGSTTREGTLTALAKIAELSYERGADGNVLLQNGQPVIGDDFYGFVDNVVGLDLEHRSADVEARLRANLYRSQQERERDETVKSALDILREETAAPSPAKEELPEALRRKQEALDRRERALNERQHGGRVEERRTFEQGLQQDAQTRISEGIQRILANVEKQGAVVSPYLKNILPKAIGAKLVRKIQANPTLQGQMQELQRLPIGDQSRQRRLAAIDRAVQQYLPDVAREELREAGVQIAASAASKRAKVDAQIDATKRTEPKGSTGPARAGGTTLNASAAFDHARTEWQKANPGKVFDNVAKEQILPRVLQLMSSW
ncbi:MAG TPA: hypothetical protein VGM27_01780 [Acidobacteriaceae bacterium]